MRRTGLALMGMVLCASALGAQSSRPSNPYEGVSLPPGDEEIVTAPAESAPQAEPAPTPASARTTVRRWSDAEEAAVQNPAAQPQSAREAAAADPSVNFPNPEAGDDGIVQVTGKQTSNPRLNTRSAVDELDPDGDIVHPEVGRPGQIGAGTTIRVRLLDRLSTSSATTGEAFRGRVASDVMQNGRLIVPAGAEIYGTVTRVTAGHPGGRGSMRLRPDTILMPSGRKYRMLAELTGTPGSDAHLIGENTVVPNSRMKRNVVEYGGAAGTGAAVGAVVAGPVGALTGAAVGAGVITVHLMVSHPQVTLESGSVLLFTLTEPLEMVAAQRGNAGQ